MEIFSLLDKFSSLIISGGYRGCGASSLTFLIGDLGVQEFPMLPKGKYGSSMVLQNGTILLCGGEPDGHECFQLKHGTWKYHSTLNRDRVFHSVVTTQMATFLFGGEDSRTTYEYLPKGSNKWLMGRTEIPGGFAFGCAIAIRSEKDILLIGGSETKNRILNFNVKDHTFTVLPFQLNEGRIRHRCAFIPNTNKIMITGGHGSKSLNSTEILDIEDGRVNIASPMNSQRRSHGMGVVTIQGKDKLVVVGGIGGGFYLNSIEIYNAQTEKWEPADIKLKEPKAEFGFLEVKFRHYKTLMVPIY